MSPVFCAILYRIFEMAKRHIFSGLNIFWRMTLGYLVVIFLVVAISAYSILSLNKINRLGSSILSIDEQVIDLEKKDG